MSVNHVNLKFAGVTDDILYQMVGEYDEWEKTGTVDNEAYLRHISAKFGTHGSPSAMLTACLMAFREIIARQERNANKAAEAKVMP